jgi:hypothetical protein
LRKGYGFKVIARPHLDALVCPGEVFCFQVQCEDAPMGGKPTYEELEQRVEELEKEAVEHKCVEKVLRESEEKYSKLVENSLTGIYIDQWR